MEKAGNNLAPTIFLPVTIRMLGCRNCAMEIFRQISNPLKARDLELEIIGLLKG
jgi:hypothetical protein